MKMQLPLFPGFYNSRLDDLMDREIESRAEYNGTDMGFEMDQFNTAIAMQAICKAWVYALNDELGTSFEFASVWSPKEYNFLTDKVTVEASDSDVAKLEALRGSKEFRHIVAEELKPRSGFAPFYSDNVDDDEWSRPLAEWGEAQTALLIQALIETELGVDTVSDLSDILLGGRFDHKFTEAAAMG